MRFKQVIRTIAIFGALAVGTFASAIGAGPSAAQPVPEGVVHLVGSGNARPVPAWVSFCERFPSECSVDTSEEDVITLTPAIWRLINAVNKQVNREIKPLTDRAQWGVVDVWDFPTTGYGDCEDYQLLKRARLAEAGLPRRAMRMTVVLDENGEGHAVLKIRTDRGDFILDNKIGSVVAWDQTGYVFIKREGTVSTSWVSLGGVVAPNVVTAAR